MDTLLVALWPLLNEKAKAEWPTIIKYLFREGMIPFCHGCVFISKLWLSNKFLWVVRRIFSLKSILIYVREIFLSWSDHWGRSELEIETISDILYLTIRLLSKSTQVGVVQYNFGPTHVWLKIYGLKRVLIKVTFPRKKHTNIVCYLGLRIK